MREIKFRAWNNKTNEMGFDENMGDILCEKEYDKPHLIIMQFTGLITRDKIEIYEGDIVVCRDGKGLIVYEPTFAKFLIDFSPENKNRLIDCEDAFRHEDADTCMRSIRVIGNMYENPELLKRDALHAKSETKDGGIK